MSRGKEIKYDVHVRDGGRWTVYTDSETKSGAIAQARSLLGTGNFDAVKVTEERGQVREIVVFEEAVERQAETAISATPIDTAPVCATLDQFCGFESRRVLARVLRKYLDHHVVTPTELMFDDMRIRGLRMNETLYNQALQLVAGVQSRRSGDRPTERMEFIERMTERVIDLCRAFRDFEIAKRDVVETGLSRALKHLAKEVSGEDIAIQRRIVLGQLLAGARDWEAKLVLLLDQVTPRATAEAIELVDEATAEIFDSAEAVRELLGYQRNTATALRTLMQLSSGSYEVSEGSDSPLERLSMLVAGRDMPLTRRVMANRVARTIGGVLPLTKGERSDEREAFADLVREFATGRAFENPDLGAAMTTRARLVYGDGYIDLAPDHAIDQVLGLLENEAARFSYLLDLCGTEFGIANQDHVIAMLAKIVNGLTSVASLVGPDVQRDDVIRAAAHIRDRLLSTMLPDKWRLRFARRIYDLLLDYDGRTGGSRIVAIERAAETAAPAAGPKSQLAKSQLAKSRPAKSQPGKSAPAKTPAPVPDPAPAEFAKPPRNAGLDQRVFAPGDYIFREGEQGDEAYLIHNGTVAIVRKSGKSEVVIAHAGPGSIVGEMALIDRAPRMASARADAKTEVTVIPLADMQKRLERLGKADPVMRHLVGMLVQRMRDYRVISVES
jgi:hypothetical protein